MYRSANAYKDCGLIGWAEKADYVECIRAMAEVIQQIQIQNQQIQIQKEQIMWSYGRGDSTTFLLCNHVLPIVNQQLFHQRMILSNIVH